jgi:hypothetical protein
MGRYKWLLSSPWLFLLVGTVLVLVSITKQIVLWETKFVFAEGQTLHYLGYGGGILFIAGVALGTLSLVRASPIQAKPLIGPSAIYIEARRMVERCKGYEIIRATSISTVLPGDDESEHPDVEAYLSTIASKCAEAKRCGMNLLYKTVFGFAGDANGVPPVHKMKSIDKRRELFAAGRADDRLVMKYIEADWSIDILIVGSEEMIIAFPTLPHDRHLQIALKIKGAEFVAQAIRWYDDCVLDAATEVTWRQGIAPGAPLAAVPDPSSTAG